MRFLAKQFPLMLLLLGACEGPVGPPGPMGNNGENGSNGDAGDPGAPGKNGEAGVMGPPGTSGENGDGGSAGNAGCNGLNAGQTPGLNVTVTVSAPANAMFFVAGEQPIIKIATRDNCARPLAPASLGTLNLYAYGPRAATLTVTATNLLNCVTDRAAMDDQHHFINLASPMYADPTHPNLTTNPDGSLTFTMAPITVELPGTYTAGVWAVANGGVDQLFPLVDFQIGTATVETYASGPGNASTCANCHQALGNPKIYMAHIAPGYSPLGNYALDSEPVANCKSCHNNGGYSVNPIIRKVHAVHRGSDQLAPGVAHPEYGLPAVDTSLATYTNVVFPSMPGKEMDCVSCHTDGRWTTLPSRLACGSCHDNVFFNTGTLVPPRIFGEPNNVPCVHDADCAIFGNFATCNVGICQRKTHPIEMDDSQCTVCHTVDPNGVAPIATVHAILARTAIPGLQITNLVMTGGSGPNGSFKVGDIPTIAFQLVDVNNKVIPDLIANKVYSPSVIIAGPTDDRQRVIGSASGAVSMKTSGTLTFNIVNGVYTYVFPSALPANALAPLDTTAPFVRPNVSGTYTMWIWISDSLTQGLASYKDVCNGVVNFSFGADLPIQPRQVITTAACDSCHVNIQAHGGSRAGDGTMCSNCHTQYAIDLGVGAKGLACTMNSQCGGFAMGWEACQDTNLDGVLDTCVVTVDPTPNNSIDFSQMIHNIHFARLREGYAEMNFLVAPGALGYLGYQNSYTDESQVLLPVDVRNCQKCHADAGNACKLATDCGMGQSCTAGKCANTAWMVPSARACLTCHDADDSFGHVALNTWQGPNGPVETCDVCHGTAGDFAVSKVHNITSPYVPPYARTPSP